MVSTCVRPILGVFVLLASQAASAEAQDKCVSSVSGELRVETLTSVVYQREITIRVWLPPGYADGPADRMYPTLYMLDGQGAFDNCTAFKGEQELQLDETALGLIAAGTIPPIVIVGIDSGTRRNHEYAPYINFMTEASAPEPVGKLLPRFFADEVIPFVRSRYRVSKDAAQTGIGGCSLGATGALWVSLHRPDLFGLALFQSPSLLLGNGQLLRDTAMLARAPDRIVIGVGTSELDFPNIDAYLAPFRLDRSEAEKGGLEMTERLANNLRAAYIKRSDVMFVVEPNASHSSRFWAGRMAAALTFLYGSSDQ